MVSNGTKLFKNMIILVGLVLLFNCFICAHSVAEDNSFYTDQTGVDSEKPVIFGETLQASKNRATVGEEITVSIKVTDNTQLDRVVISVINKNSRKFTNSEGMVYNPNKELWEYVFRVDENTPNGPWCLDYIQAYDKIGNLAYFGEEETLFEIYDAADSERPVIHKDTLEVSKQRATIGDKVKISIKITDNISVDRAIITLNNLDSGASTPYYPMAYDSSTDRWEYYFEITDQTPDGNWSVDYLVAYDQAGNFIGLLSDEPAFEVYGAADSERPVIYLDTLSISQKTATLGDKIKVSVKVTENVKMDWVTISFRNVDTGKMESFNKMTGPSETDIWEFIFEVTTETPNGQWIIDDLQAYDIYGNYDIMRDTVSAFFTYSNDAGGNPNYYTIKYNSNGNGEPDIEELFLLNKNRPLMYNEFSRTGYSFDSWNTKPDGSGIKYTEGQNVCNLSSIAGGQVTLYAQWIPEQYWIQWKNWNGQILRYNYADYDSIPEYHGETPSRVEDDIYTYVFTGWEPEIQVVKGPTEYTAVYQSVVKTPKTEDDTTEESTVSQGSEEAETTDSDTMEIKNPGDDAEIAADKSDDRQFDAQQQGSKESSQTVESHDESESTVKSDDRQFDAQQQGSKESSQTVESHDESESTVNTEDQKAGGYFAFSGIKQMYRLGSKENLQFIIKRFYNDEDTYRLLLRVLVDGRLLNKEYYNTRPGSLIIELKPEYIETLSQGEHILHVDFEDGEIEIPFSVYKENDDVKEQVIPKTGDNSDPFLWLGIMIVGCIALVISVIVNKAERNKQGFFKER